MSLKYKWVNSIESIDKYDWDNLYKNESILKSYKFTSAIENSNLEGVKFNYLLIYKQGKISTIFPCFTYRVKLEILAGNSLKRIASIIRYIYPNFLQTKLFVIGSPVATCENHISKDYNEIDFNIIDVLIEKSKEQKTQLTIIKEIPHCELLKCKNFFLNFTFFESLPNSFVPLSQEYFPYPKILRSNYKKKFKKAILKSDKDGYKWEFIKDFSHLIKETHELYLNVFNKSDYKFEKLNMSFFKMVNEFLPDESSVLVCRSASGELVSVELIIEGDNELIPMYLGLNYKYTQDPTVYNNVIFRTLLEAEKRNKNCLVLGQTSYEAKAIKGALFEKTYLGIYSYKRSMKFIIKYFLKYLFPEFTKPNVNGISNEIKKTPMYTDTVLNFNKIFE